MIQPELFDNLRQYRLPLTKQSRDNAIKTLVKKAKAVHKYFYSTKEACAILHCSRDELHTILKFYQLDAILFLSVYRIPWYELVGYIDYDLDEKPETPEEILHSFFTLPTVEIDPLPNCPVILTPEETAHICHVSLETIYRMIKKGDLATNCDGDIRRTDLKTYIKTHAFSDIPLL
ncbi:MAG: helix-turn-helix domain-containing protein [Treponemataceae bacterium]